MNRKQFIFSLLLGIIPNCFIYLFSIIISYINMKNYFIIPVLYLGAFIFSSIITFPICFYLIKPANQNTKLRRYLIFALWAIFSESITIIITFITGASINYAVHPYINSIWQITLFGSIWVLGTLVYDPKLLLGYLIIFIIISILLDKELGISIFWRGQ